MKNFIYTLIFIFGALSMYAQTVQATVKKANDNCVTVFALPSADVTDPPSNFVVTISVPDQSGGGTNPTANVIDILPDMQVDPGTPAPFISGGRYYIDLNFTPTIGSPAPLAWTGLVEYPLATVCFTGATPPPVDELVQINDLTASGGGNNGFSYWYFETQGSGDLTNYATKFYDDGGVTVNATNGGDSQAETTESIALPIELVRFSAFKKENDVQLNWTSETEINASHFEIERSQNGDNWTYIGTVEAVGESSVDVDYEFLDNNLPLNLREDDKTFYYRLKMVDNDAKYDYSEIRSVRFDIDGEANFLVYPNPSFDEVYVNLSEITAETGPATLRIINASGQLVKKVKLTSSNDIKVDVSDLTAGIYNFVATHGEQRFIEKIIKID